MVYTRYGSKQQTHLAAQEEYLGLIMLSGYMDYITPKPEDAHYLKNGWPGFQEWTFLKLNLSRLLGMVYNSTIT